MLDEIGGRPGGFGIPEKEDQKEPPRHDFSLFALPSGFPGSSDVKNLPADAGDLRLIPGSGRSPGEGNGNLLEYSCLENPMTEKPGGLQSIGSQRIGYS